jgi:hypothetical protein
MYSEYASQLVWFDNNPSYMNFIWGTINVNAVSVIYHNPIKWRDYYFKNCFLSHVSHFIIILISLHANANVILHDIVHRLN